MNSYFKCLLLAVLSLNLSGSSAGSGNANPSMDLQEPPDVDFTFTNNSTCSGTPIEFMSNVSGTGPYTYTWNFGDEETSTVKNPIHTYTALGCGTENFTVSLTVSYDTLSVSMSKTITVIQQPDIEFIDVNSPYDPFSNCNNASITNPGYSITVDNNSASKSCITSYSLNWGDGSPPITDVTFPIDHTYENLGAFNMVISAMGANGCNTSVTYVVKNQTNPSGGLISPGTTTNLCAPTEELQFEIAKWGNNSPGTIYEVDYGDGSPILTFTQEELVNSSPTLSVNYPIPHVYDHTNCPESQFTATLTVRNACNSTTFTADNITILTTPKADFTVPDACLNTEVLITNTTIPGGGINCSETANFTWNFGDGSDPETQTLTLPEDVTHTYTSTGTYDISLTAENFCGSTTIIKQIEVSPLPTATISGGDNICQGADSPVITFTGANGIAPYTFTYKINNGPNRTISTDSESDTVTIQAPTDTPGTFTYTLVSVELRNTSGCSQPQTGEAVVVVVQAPSGIVTGIDTVCLNAPSPSVIFTGTNGIPPYTFTYNINDGSNQTISTSANDSVSIQVPTNSGGVFRYNLIDVQDAGGNSCSLTQTGYATITVNDQRPELMELSDYEFCNGERTSEINFSNIVPGTTFRWTSTDTSIGLAESGNGNIGPFTAQNSTEQKVTSTITVIPELYGCTGSSQTFTITVHPAVSVVFSEDDQTICSGERTVGVTLNSSTPDAELSWTTEQPPGIAENISLSGTNMIPEQTLTNTTNEPITIIYKATLSGTGNCAGVENIYRIVVTPGPVVTGNLTDTICSGSSFNISPPNGGGNYIPFGTTFTWSEPVISPSGTIAGASEQTESQQMISQELENTSSGLATAKYTVIPNLNGCEGHPFDVVVAVNPTVTVEQPMSQTVCSSNNTSEILFSGNSPEAVYNWTVSDNIGLPLNGTGNIPEFTAINDNADSVVAVISVTPALSGCEGISKNFTITVYPSAIILKQPSSSSICLGEEPTSLSVIHTTGVSSPNYQWYSNTSNSYTGASLIPNATDPNYIPPSSSARTTYYFCEIEFPGGGGCNSLTSDIAKVKVNPNPIVVLNDELINPGEELKICPGDSFPVYARGADTYLWNADWSGDSILVTTIGDYRTIGTSQNGCKDTFNFKVSYYGNFNYSIQTNRSEVTDEQNQVHLWTDNIQNSFYTWDFGDGSAGFGYDVIHMYDISTDGYFDVKLEVINPYGCLEETSNSIRADLAPTSIPNTFTPNGDGINDNYLNGWYKKVFNRNGILLYQGQQGWDGNYKGKPVANDTYFVVIYDSSEMGAEYKRMYVTVLR